jgi:hypothetical protein
MSRRSMQHFDPFLQVQLSDRIAPTLSSAGDLAEKLFSTLLNNGAPAKLFGSPVVSLQAEGLPDGKLCCTNQLILRSFVTGRCSLHPTAGQNPGARQVHVLQEAAVAKRRQVAEFMQLLLRPAHRVRLPGPSCRQQSFSMTKPCQSTLPANPGLFLLQFGLFLAFQVSRARQARADLLRHCQCCT